MSGLRKLLLAMLLVATVTVILVTWGSIGSIVLTLGLLLALSMIAMRYVLDRRDPDDFDWNG
jgi:hypothetical protein